MIEKNSVFIIGAGASKRIRYFYLCPLFGVEKIYLRKRI